MKSIQIVAAVIAAMAMFMVAAKADEEAVNCGQVDLILSPCMDYLIHGGEPKEECCNGIKKLEEITPTTQDRRTACECVKEAALRIKNINDEAAKQLPTKCHVSVKIPISKDIDCTKIEGKSDI